MPSETDGAANTCGGPIAARAVYAGLLALDPVLLLRGNLRASDHLLDWRCLGVNFDEQHGHRLASMKLLLETCLVTPTLPILSIATVFCRLNDTERQMSLEEACNYEVS
ncbi:hypothetical protein ECG_04679 [Echinococcus granulosus]|nr:hypothetical protein ECG_04679 [Echinococcus granulosus]